MEELIKKIDLADQLNKETGGNFGRTMSITMEEALMVKHLLEKQSACKHDFIPEKTWAHRCLKCGLVEYEKPE